MIFPICVSLLRFYKILANPSYSVIHLAAGTKEAAYTQAIISAGVVYTITKACSMGNLSECNCDKKKWGQKSNKGWMWGGCSVDVSYGIDLSERFVNARRNKEDAIFLMNKHNSRAGRQVGGLSARQNLMR